MAIWYLRKKEFFKSHQIHAPYYRRKTLGLFQSYLWNRFNKTFLREIQRFYHRYFFIQKVILLLNGPLRLDTCV